MTGVSTVTTAAEPSGHALTGTPAFSRDTGQPAHRTQPPGEPPRSSATEARQDSGPAARGLGCERPLTSWASWLSHCVIWLSSSPRSPARRGLQAAVLAEVPGEEPQRAVQLECRDFPVFAWVGVQRLLR